MAHQESNDMIKGILLGGILGGVAGLLLAPKAGQQLREQLFNGYEHNVAPHFENNHPAEEGRGKTVMTGAALGAVVCAIAALLLAPQSGKKLREELGDKYDEIHERAQGMMNRLHEKGADAMEHAEEWKDVLATLVNKLSTSKKRAGSNLDTILDWATLGVQLLQQVKARR